MYKNTVSECEPEAPTLVRVQDAWETKDDLDGCMRELTHQCVNALIFPNKELLNAWRMRLAALA